MLSLAFGEKSLDVQRKVVSEEFKEHYLNKPYGDAWHLLREMAYTQHPYRWMTIGKELKHIEEAKLEDVKSFFFKHYTPANAIMVVAGNVETPQVKTLAEKWFGGIPSGNKYVRNLPQEPLQTQERRMVVKKDVPLDALYKCWHMPDRTAHAYYVTDLITDILGGGTSSRLYQALVKEQKFFSNVECYHFGSLDKGLIAIEGKLVKGVKPEVAEAAIELVLDGMRQQPVEEKELQKVKNKSESLMAFEDMSLMNRANSLAFYELLGDANLMNQEMQQYNSVTLEQVKALSAELFAKENSNTLYYLSDKRI